MATFGEKMKAIRFYLGYTQEEIANKLGVTKQVISKYENEQTSPRIDTVANFAKILLLDLTFLINETFSTDEVIKAIDNRDLSIKPITKKGSSQQNSPSHSPSLVRLVKTANTLNDAGQGKLADYADDLASSGKYSKDKPSTFKDSNGHLRLKDYQTDEKPLPYVASRSFKDDGSHDEELADLVRRIQEEDIERG